MLHGRFHNESECMHRGTVTPDRYGFSDCDERDIGFNPQDPECASFKHESFSKNIRRKPSRAILYVRNHAHKAVGNVSVCVVGFLLVSLSFHRILSLYMRHRKWVNAPITYVNRQCPALGYDALGTTAGKICITTLTDHKSPSYFQRFLRWRNFDGILDLTWQNKKDYAKLHGYHLFDASHLIDTSRPPAWSKIKAVSHLLGPSMACEWVLWTDADTVIMNSDIRIEDILPADASKDLLVASDKGGGYNSGVFLFRNSEWSLQILQEWWEMTEFVQPPGLSLSGDNAAMKALLRDMKDFEEHVLVPPRCTFNSFAKFLTVGESIGLDMDHLDDMDWFMDSEHYHKGDFIAHTPGIDNKAEALQLLLREAQ